MLLLSLLCLLRTGFAAAQETEELQTRQARLLALILEYGEADLADRAAPASEGASQAGSHLILDARGRPAPPRGSLEYAAALLTADLRPERAEAVINDVLATQAPHTAGRHAGAFPWQLGGDPDPAATAHVAPWLAYIHREFGGKLSAETRARVAASLEPALQAVGRLKVAPEQSDLFLTKLGAEAMLAREVTGEGSKAASRVGADLAAWTKFTRSNGIPAAQSPSYCVDAVAGLNWAWLAAPDEEAREAAADGLEYLYRDIALRFHPKSGMLAGAAVRAFPRDYISGLGAIRYLLYAHFGKPELDSAPPFAMFLVVPGFVPNQETRALGTAVDVPRTIRSCALDRAASTYLQTQFSLGTMSGPLDSQTVPVLLTYPNQDRPSAYGSVRPVPARVAAVQKDAKALVSFDFDDVGYDLSRIMVGVDFHLGTEDVLDGVLVNQTPYTTDYAVTVPTKSSVVVERDGVFTSITVVAHGPAVPKKTDAPAKPAELEWVSGDAGGARELVLRVAARDERKRELARSNYRVAVAIEMAVRDAFRSIEEFADHIYQTRSGCELEAKRVKVGENVEGPLQTVGPHRPVERARWIFDYRVVQELQYQSGDDVLMLTEDLEKNEVVSRQVNGVEEDWTPLYRSPSLNHMPGDALDAVLRPPPPPPEPEEPEA